MPLSTYRRGWDVMSHGVVDGVPFCHLIFWYPASSCLPLTPSLPWYTPTPTEKKVSPTVLQILFKRLSSIFDTKGFGLMSPSQVNPQVFSKLHSKFQSKKSRTFQAVDLEKKQAGQVKNFTNIKRSCASKNLPTKSSSPKKASNCHFTGIAETFETWPR